MNEERTGCIIPLCKRTTGRRCDYWICGQHWKGTPRRWRMLFFKAQRRTRSKPTLKNWKRENRIWFKLVAIATDRAFP